MWGKKKFQFHIGLIKTVSQDVSDIAVIYFNSTLVWLKHANAFFL